MSEAHIQGEGYSVHKAGGTYVFRGSIRLGGQEEYGPLIELLSRAIPERQAKVVLDLRELQFLNSAGLYVLSQLVVRLRDAAQADVEVRASGKIFWQGKSLKNLRRLMPALVLSFE